MKLSQRKKKARVQGILLFITCVIAMVLLWTVTPEVTNNDAKWVITIVLSFGTLLALSGYCDHLDNKGEH